MSPLVRGFKEGEPQARGAFVVDLGIPEAFDPDLFDRNAFSLRANPEATLFYLKWLVRNERMIVFGEEEPGGWRIEHGVFNYFLESNGDPGPLQSAGHMLMFQPEGSSGLIREIQGHSMTLDRILSKEESDRYKLEVIKPALQDHFKVY